MCGREWGRLEGSAGRARGGVARDKGEMGEQQRFVRLIALCWRGCEDNQSERDERFLLVLTSWGACGW